MLVKKIVINHRWTALCWPYYSPFLFFYASDWYCSELYCFIFDLELRFCQLRGLYRNSGIYKEPSSLHHPALLFSTMPALLLCLLACLRGMSIPSSSNFFPPSTILCRSRNLSSPAFYFCLFRRFTCWSFATNCPHIPLPFFLSYFSSFR